MTEALVAPWIGFWPAVQSGAVGLLNRHATHNVLVDTPYGPITGRDDWAASLHAEWAGFSPDTVIDRTACASPLGSLGAAVFVATGVAARNTGESAFGPATGKDVILSSATLALVSAERIYRAWRFVDRSAVVDALGASPVATAASLVANVPSRGGVPWEYGEMHAGNHGDASGSRDSIAGLPPAFHRWARDLHAHWTTRELADAGPVYSADAAVASGFEPLRPIRRLADHPWRALLTALPDAVLFFERGCASEDAASGARVAILWRWVGRHTGVGLGVPPSGHRLHVRGLSYFELADGNVMIERVFTDRLGTLADIQRRQRLETT